MKEFRTTFTSQQSFRTGVRWGINGPQGCGWGAQNGKVSLTRPYLWQIWCFVRSQKYQTLRKRKVHDLDTFFAENLEHHLTAKFLFPMSFYFHPTNWRIGIQRQVRFEEAASAQRALEMFHDFQGHEISLKVPGGTETSQKGPEPSTNGPSTMEGRFVDVDVNF